MLLRYITIEYTRMENILVQLLMSQVKKKPKRTKKPLYITLCFWYGIN